MLFFCVRALFFEIILFIIKLLGINGYKMRQHSNLLIGGLRFLMVTIFEKMICNLDLYHS